MPLVPLKCGAQETQLAKLMLPIFYEFNWYENIWLIDLPVSFYILNGTICTNFIKLINYLHSECLNVSRRNVLIAIAQSFIYIYTYGHKHNKRHHPWGTQDILPYIIYLFWHLNTFITVIQKMLFFRKTQNRAQITNLHLPHAHTDKYDTYEENIENVF